MLLYQLSVFLHILSAIVWIGGMLFLALVIVPATRGLPPPDRSALFSAVGRRFRAVGWVCIGLLLLTGIVNSAYRGVTLDNVLTAELWTSPFGRVLSLKLAVVAVMLTLSLYHDFVIGPRSVRVTTGPQAQQLRRLASYVGRIEAILALIVVALAIMLVRGLPF
jgi:putative copper export protein